MPDVRDNFLETTMREMVGRRIPARVRGEAQAHCEQMGCALKVARDCVNAVANELEAGSFEAAQKAALQTLDLTGACRLLAVLLGGAAGASQADVQH